MTDLAMREYRLGWHPEADDSPAVAQRWVALARMRDLLRARGQPITEPEEAAPIHLRLIAPDGITTLAHIYVSDAGVGTCWLGSTPTWEFCASLARWEHPHVKGGRALRDGHYRPGEGHALPG